MIVAPNAVNVAFVLVVSAWTAASSNLTLVVVTMSQKEKLWDKNMVLETSSFLET